jgi:tetratricopeptide (TPR) repeat protein
VTYLFHLNDEDWSLMPTLFDVDQTLETAIAHQQSGLWREAEELYRQVLVADPDNVDALNLLSVIALDTGRFAEAEDLLGRALGIDPDFAEALTNQARVLDFLRRPEEALKASTRAVELDPDLGEAWQQLGLSNVRLLRGADALAAFRKAEALLPDSIDVQAGLAEAAKLVADHAVVADALQSVLAARPDDVKALIDLGIAFTELKRMDDATPLLRHALELSPDNPHALIALAVALHKQQADAEELVAICRRALGLVPNSIDVHVLMGSALTWLGRFDEAKAAFERVLSLRPDHEEARSLLASLVTDEGGEQDLTMLRTRMEDTHLTALNRAGAGHMIGRTLDRASDYDGAFEAYDQGNRIMSEWLRETGKQFDRAELQYYVDWAITTFTADLFTRQQPYSDPSELPVFIVGMPRSGTSLVEQILSSHPAVFGIGERKDMELILQRITIQGSRADPAQWEPTLAHIEVAQQIAMLRDLARGAMRVTNKLPDNVLILGQIALLFPNARVIMCERDLRDVGLSCFTSFFSEEVPWSTSLDDIGFRAMTIKRLREHWRRVVPLRMIEVRYENLIANQEAESRRLIDFLGLDWDPACLNFQNNKKGMATASYWQVRQPIYDTSIGRWKHFERHLQPLLERLSPGAPVGRDH